MTRGTTLTPKQAAFCAFVARGDTQTDAYIKAYDVQNLTDEAHPTKRPSSVGWRRSRHESKSLKTTAQ
jgi:hypothetical protein